MYGGKFAGPVNRNIQVQLAFTGPYFGNVDVDWRRKQRCSAQRVRCEIVGRSA